MRSKFVPSLTIVAMSVPTWPVLAQDSGLEEIVDRRISIADGARELIGRLDSEARSIERGVKRLVACRHAARRRVTDDLA